jgi:hypothetical protein
MILLRRGLLALSAAALATTAASLATTAAAQILWLKVEGPDRAFTVEMPGTPEYKLVAQLHTYSLARGPIEFVMQSVEVGYAAPAREILQSALDGAAPHLAGGKWQRVDWREVQGAPAVEAAGALKDGNVLRNLLVLKGRRLVSLGMRGPTGTMRFPDAERYFASLRFAP